MIVNPSDTLIRVSGTCAAIGVLLALLGVLGIYLGSTRLPPRLHPRHVWTEWRRKRMVWGLCLMLSMLGAWLITEQYARQAGLRDLYWLTRSEDLLTICRLAGGTGYLLTLLVVVVGALLTRRHPPSPGRARGR